MSDSVLARLLRDNPIVVTGLGSFSAAGDSVEALWSAAIAGQSLASWREFDLEGERAQFAVCAAPEFSGGSSGLFPVRKMDRCVQMAWLAADQAWSQARLADFYPPERVGVFVGSSRGPLGKRAESFGLHGRHKYPPSFAASNTFACINGALAQAFNLKGPGATVSATCASAAFAIGMAAEQILLGKADAMIVGGTEAPLYFSVPAQFRSAGVLGFHEVAAQTCRPFDVTRNGMVLGEGSAFLVLESARAASARGIAACAQLTGWEFGMDDAGRTGVHEDGSGLLHVMRQALSMAGLRPEQIDYINAHGTGTKMNDASEARAVRQLLEDRALTVPCSSTKPVTGHCLGATPALEAVLCIEALRRQRVPPTANCLQPDPLCPIQPQPLKGKSARLTNVMSNSLGFWGFHSALIFSNPDGSHTPANL